MYELTSTQGTRDELSDAWPDGVLYNGLSIFEVIYNDDDCIKDTFGKKLCEDWQECYLGYVKDEDFFVMGFDTWPDRGEKRNNIFSFEMTASGRIKNVSIMATNGRMFYSDKNLSTLHEEYPSLVDVRLD